MTSCGSLATSFASARSMVHPCRIGFPKAAYGRNQKDAQKNAHVSDKDSKNWLSTSFSRSSPEAATSSVAHFPANVTTDISNRHSQSHQFHGDRFLAALMSNRSLGNESLNSTVSFQC